MSKYKDFLVVESDLDTGEMPEISQIFDFIKASDIKNAAKIAKNRGYNIPQNAAIIENTSQNISTQKLSVIAEIIRKMIDKGLDDKQLSANTRELRQIMRLLRQVKNGSFGASL